MNQLWELFTFSWYHFQELEKTDNVIADEEKEEKEKEEKKKATEGDEEEGEEIEGEELEDEELEEVEEELVQVRFFAPVSGEQPSRWSPTYNVMQRLWGDGNCQVNLISCISFEGE